MSTARKKAAPASATSSKASDITTLKRTVLRRLRALRGQASQPQSDASLVDLVTTQLFKALGPEVTKAYEVPMDEFFEDSVLDMSRRAAWWNKPMLAVIEQAAANPSFPLGWFTDNPLFIRAVGHALGANPSVIFAYALMDSDLHAICAQFYSGSPLANAVTDRLSWKPSLLPTFEAIVTRYVLPFYFLDGVPHGFPLWESTDGDKDLLRAWHSMITMWFASHPNAMPADRPPDFVANRPAAFSHTVASFLTDQNHGRTLWQTLATEVLLAEVRNTPSGQIGFQKEWSQQMREIANQIAMVKMLCDATGITMPLHPLAGVMGEASADLMPLGVGGSRLAPLP